MAQSSTTLQQVSLSSSLTSSPYASSHLDHTLLNSTSNGGYESAIYSLTPDLASLSNTGTDPGSQKITLLTRNHPTNTGPAQPPLSSSPLGSRLDDSVLSRMASSVHSSSLLTSADSSPLSRQRDYYFDTEDPSVNLHDFIINSLQAPKNRVILLQLEEEFLKYISDPSRSEPLKLPSWDSYHRMLAHRVAAYFGLEHNVDPQDKTRVVVAKGPSTRLPQQRFSDHIPTTVYEESDINEPKSILKRIRGSSGSEKFDGLPSNPASEIKTFEEREEEYEKARARIFSQSSTQLHETDPVDIPFDLFSSSPFARSALRTPLHHRRTFSDTAFINKLFSQKENKQGPSSSGNSPSSTPAFFPPSPPTLSASSSSTAVGVINQTQVTPEDVSQHSSRQHQKRTITTRPQPPTFIPFYSGAPPAIPVMYHPQPVIDPSWYYNHMLVYPVAPQAGYPVPQFVQSPVIPHYSLQQPQGIISAPASRVNTLGIRIPSAIMADHMGSPTHSIYPSISQQTTGTQLKSDDYSNNVVTPTPLWSPQAVPIPPTLYSTQQQPSSTPQYVHHSTANVMPQLTEQMEKSLSLSEGDANDPDKLVVSPIGQRQPVYGRTFGRGQMNMYGYPNVHTGMDPVVLSPTGLVPPSQFIPGPPEHMQGTLPPNSISFPSNLPLHGREQPHPATPTLPPGVIQTGGPSMQSPVQILGHTLSTTIFSPPPSAGPPGLFMNPTGSGKPNSPGHSAVGSGIRFQRYDSPQQTRPDLALQTQVMHDNVAQSYKNAVVTSDGTGLSQPLPPRLAQRGSGTRYQNQRHPSNRPNMKPEQDQQQYTANTRYPPRKEPLLPTPAEMIKLDTGITAGVPVHIMEVLHPPSEESSDNQQLLSKLQEHGALEFKRGWMNRNTEIMVAIFDNSDTALQALKQCVLPPPAKLSIPLPTHAKHILQLL